MMIDRHRLGRWGLAIAALLLCAAPLLAQPTDDPARVDRYRSQWLEAERAAKTDADRAELAKRLLSAARDAAKRDPAYALYICRRAYLMGAAARPSYATAAEALELMTEIDPTLKLESLEKVRDLYQHAYHENPTVNLGLGMRSAEATALVARQRRRALDGRLAAGEADAGDVLVEANKVMREWAQARRTAAAVINSARSIERRLTARGSDQAALVATFIREHESDLEHFESQLQRAARFKDAAVALKQASGRLAEKPEDAETRRQLARLSLLVFDSPALARSHASALGDGEAGPKLDLAAKPMGALTAVDRLDLAGWYAALSDAASSELAQRRGLAKARALLAGCDEAFEADDERYAQAEALAETLAKRQSGLGVAASPLALAPRPVAVAAAESEPEQTETADPFDDDALWGEPAQRDEADDEAGADERSGEASASGIDVAADPRAHDTPPESDDSFEAGGDDGYWASREESIFDFGRD